MPFTNLADRQAYAQRYYRDNRRELRERGAKRYEATRALIREFIASYLADKACVDCDESDPIVLDFDHRGDKEFNIGEAAGLGVSLDRVKAEVAKCDIRCANCHRRKTYRERNMTHKGPFCLSSRPVDSGDALWGLA